VKKLLTISAALLLLQFTQAQDTTDLSSETLKLYPILWQQTAAEYRALCYQAFNIARLRIDSIIQGNPGKTDLAIVTDLDETILNSSNVSAQVIKTGRNINPQEWLQWTKNTEPPTVPGAVEFLQYAGSKGAHIFYISNRDVKGLQFTVSILQRLKLPDADTSHMLFLSNDFSKESRRQTVMKNYDVVMLLGDNLNDFMQVFEDKTIAERLNETDKVKEEWGKKFIVLPNAAYGEWENALYNYNDTLPFDQKMIKLKSLLQGLEDKQ
jgi:5'-nucleotidase (lipoprotein e(P4) family)